MYASVSSTIPSDARRAQALAPSGYQTDGLGAFAIPSWLKNIVGAVVRGTTVTVPIPGAGPQTFDLSKPADVNALNALREALKGTQVSFSTTPKPSTPGEVVQAGVANIPGGWLTLAAVGAALVLFSGGLGLGKLGRR